MKEHHWKALSLVATSALIVLVSSWAMARPSPVDFVDPVVVKDGQRYVMTIGHASSKESDKYFLYDSWELEKTQDIWMLDKPHKPEAKWQRMTLKFK